MLAAGTTTGLETRQHCQVCAEVTGLTGAGIVVLSGDLPRGSVCTTDDVSALDEHLMSASARPLIRLRKDPEL